MPITGPACLYKPWLPGLPQLWQSIDEGPWPQHSCHANNIICSHGVPGTLAKWPGAPSPLADMPSALQVLSGQRQGLAGMHISGQVLYNGHSADEQFSVQRTCALVGQRDCHLGNLTVDETLAFAALCQVGCWLRVPGALQQRACGASHVLAMLAKGRRKVLCLWHRHEATCCLHHAMRPCASML